jgi:hypothetical protein
MGLDQLGGDVVGWTREGEDDEGAHGAVHVGSPEPVDDKARPAPSSMRRAKWRQYTSSPEPLDAALTICPSQHPQRCGTGSYIHALGQGS